MDSPPTSPGLASSQLTVSPSSFVFLVDVPDFDRLLGWICRRITGREVHRIQVRAQGVAHGQLELEQIVERQTERGDAPIDVADRQRWPYRRAITISLDAVDLHWPGAVLVALPPDRFRGKQIGIGSGGYKLRRRVRNRVPMKAQHVRTVVRTVQLKEQYFAARLKNLDVTDQRHSCPLWLEGTVKGGREFEHPAAYRSGDGIFLQVNRPS